jgi:hypothetical protein
MNAQLFFAPDGERSQEREIREARSARCAPVHAQCPGSAEVIHPQGCRPGR